MNPQRYEVNYDGPDPVPASFALAVREDGKRKICLSCAEAHAQQSGFPNLYFAINPIFRISGQSRCECGKYMGAVVNCDAAARVADLVVRGSKQ